MTRCMLIFLTLVACAAVSAELPPISAFAQRPITDLSLSPDGRYLLYVTSLDGAPAAVTIDRQKDYRRISVMAGTPNSNFDFEWCGWANATRILCGYRGVLRPDVLEREMRLIAVDADGTAKQNFQSWSVNVAMFGQFAPLQSRVIDFNPGTRGRVLIQMSTGWAEYPSVLELDVYNGRARPYADTEPSIRQFETDGWGNVRLGVGPRDAKLIYNFKYLGDPFWREWARIDVVPRGPELAPVQVIHDTNSAYAIGPLSGREALWKVDLERKSPPQVVFAAPGVDIRTPIFSRDRKLLGIAFETDRPSAHYIDQRAASLIEGANRVLPNAYNEIIDSSNDGKIFLIRSSSDVDAGSYYLIDASTGAGDLELLGSSYPNLDRSQLGRMQSIEYRAAFDAKITGYLTLPPGEVQTKLPLVVMPHDGPDARDSWEFDFLRHFLVSRGYAVLQPNYRGSRGFGSEWLEAANGEWGELPSADIRYAASWAVAQGIADPARVCILGWGFGGYQAQLAAIRDGDRFRCAVSIAGFSDLKEHMDERGSSAEREILRRRIGTDRNRLQADSPLVHAARVAVPVLLVHGTHDLDVRVVQSKRMAAALTRAGRPHELVIIEGAEHDLRRESDRTALMSAVEIFLAGHLK